MNLYKVEMIVNRYDDTLDVVTYHFMAENEESAEKQATEYFWATDSGIIDSIVVWRKELCNANLQTIAKLKRV